MIYDLFYVSTRTVNKNSWEKFKNKFPTSKLIENVSEFSQIKRKAFTKFFWIVWDDLELVDDFDFKYNIPDWDEQYVHVFLNGENYNGIALVPKTVEITDEGFKYRYYNNTKQIEIVASYPKLYDRFVVKTYDDYLAAKSNSTTDMFWIVWNDVDIIDETIFKFIIDRNNAYELTQNHVFKNAVSDDAYYIGGIILANKSKDISKKEFDSRHIIQRKEWNREVSKSLPYEKFVVDTYEDYLTAKEKSLTEMFWVIPKEIEVIDFNFDLRIPYSDSYNKKINHVFQHRFKNDLTYNGIFLTNTNLTLTKKEIEYRSPVNRKEYQVLASKMRPYDMVFISYNEVNADENYQRLLRRFPRAKRIHGVKGIHQAHIEAAKLVDTDMFWAVDADAVILDDFNFDYEVSRYDRHTVHVWSSQNPVNDLVYGYGGVKLLPTTLTINTDIHSTDMTTSISNKFKSIPDISNITAFNTDPFNTWKSAFRECVKLSSQIIDRQDSEETEQRLNVWTTEGADKLYGEYAIQGANEGRDYGHKYKTDIDQLKKINDFDWLYNYFTEHTKIKTEI